MAITDHKIPIITGRNDVPTTSESEANHPNGSYVTQKYNLLADEAESRISALEAYHPVKTTETATISVYVDSGAGNDNNDGLTLGTAFQTIDKAMEYLSSMEIVNDDNSYQIVILLVGTFIDPRFDFSPLIIEDKHGTFWGGVTQIEIQSNDFNNKATINLTGHDLIRNNRYRNTIRFRYLQINTDVPIVFSNQPALILLWDCDFASTVNNTSEIIYVGNSVVGFYTCTFNSLASSTYNAISLTDKAKVYLDDCTYDGSKFTWMTYSEGNSEIINLYGSNFQTNNNAPKHDLFGAGAYLYYDDDNPDNFQTSGSPSSILSYNGWLFKTSSQQVQYLYNGVFASTNFTVHSSNSFVSLSAYSNGNQITLADTATNFTQPINLLNSGELRVNGTKVVGVQQSAIADSAGGDEQAKINAILTALRNHGLIAS